jgi:hypothetical protein
MKSIGVALVILVMYFIINETHFLKCEYDY